MEEKSLQSSCCNPTQVVCRAKSFADDLVTERGIVNGRVAHCYDPLRLSLRSFDLSHWVSGGRSHPLVVFHPGGHCSKLPYTRTSRSGVLLPPLSGEVKALQHLHARVCARSGTCQMWDRDSATTDRHVCRQCKTMRAGRGERLSLLVCIVGLASCSDHAEHC